MSRSARPTPKQAEYLRRFLDGFGPLGVDLRTYDALLRRGWIEERTYEDTKFGLGTRTRTYTTDAGRAALDAVHAATPAASS